MNSSPTATLCVFAYAGLTAHTHACIRNETRNWPNLHEYDQCEDAAIDRERSRAASAFLKQDDGGDVLLMVDYDIGWQPGDLSMIARRALEHTAIVGGIYPKRSFGQGAAMRFDSEANGKWKIGQDALIQAIYASAGFVAIPRIVLHSVSEVLPQVIGGFWPLFMPMTVPTALGHEYLSEDWAFCHRAREEGYKVLLSTYPRLTHEGPYTFRLVDGRARPPRGEEVTIELNPLSSPALAGEGE